MSCTRQTVHSNRLTRFGLAGKSITFEHVIRVEFGNSYPRAPNVVETPLDHVRLYAAMLEDHRKNSANLLHDTLA